MAKSSVIYGKELKTCLRCGKERELRAFRPDLRYKAGVTGWCRRCRRDETIEHRERAIRPAPGEASKRCGYCKETKVLSQFSRDPRAKDGRGARCKFCRRQVEGPRRTPGGWQRNHLWYFYGMRPEDYDALLAAQAGKCLICAKLMLRPCVDHCHDTGAVRGLLCGKCNTYLKGIEDPAFFQAATAYLERAARTTPRFIKRQARAIVDGEPCHSTVAK